MVVGLQPNSALPMIQAFPIYLPIRRLSFSFCLAGINSGAVTMAVFNDEEQGQSRASGTLPTGLALAAGTGIISGIPATAGGPNSIIFHVVDSVGGSATAILSITVNDPGLLRVQTVPAVTTRIFIDGIPRENWGLNYVKMPAGSYTLSFSNVTGYDNPTSLTISNTPGGSPISQPITTPIVVYPDVTTTVIANFTQLGNLQVSTSPAVPATIYVNGNPMDDWGMWADLLPGSYIVSFESLNGFISPPPQTVTVTAGATTSVVGNYSAGINVVTPPATGLLRIQTVPAVPSRIFINGIPRENWGLNYVKMPAGSYTLSFSNVTGFDNPPTVTVTNTPGGTVTQALTTPIVITSGVTTEVVANFVALGNLRVNTSPAVPSTIFVNGNPMDDWGMWADIEVGSYTVSFSPVTSFTTPPPLLISVTSGATTHVVGDFALGTTQVVP